MPRRPQLALALLASVALFGGAAASAAPKPGPAPKAVQEVITIQRTATHGLAALALIGKISADRVPGFFGTVDSSQYGAVLGSLVDFNSNSGLTRYGHGAAAPLCSAPFVCSVDATTGTLTFTMTETDDADSPNADWTGLTRYIAIRGTKLDLQVAAIGFTVKRHTTSSFARVTRDQADADGVAEGQTGAEVFRSAQLAGGARGSFVALQLPCDGDGAGAATFSTAGDLVPPVVDCEPTQGATRGYTLTIGGGQSYPNRPGVFSRTSGKAALWQVSGMVTGLSGTATRLFVLSY